MLFVVAVGVASLSGHVQILSEELDWWAAKYMVSSAPRLSLKLPDPDVNASMVSGVVHAASSASG